MVSRALFDPPRCATQGITKTLNAEIQFTLWAMVDLLRLRSGVEASSVQIFELAPSPYPDDRLNQAMLHRQYEPYYVATNLMAVEKPVTARILIVDDGQRATMMLESEYGKPCSKGCE